MITMPEQIPQEDDTFLKLVDFKWLMAGLGWRVDLSRLQRDTAYADECAQRALASGSELLRERSIALLPLMRPSGTHASACLPTRVDRSRVVKEAIPHWLVQPAERNVVVNQEGK